MSLSELSASDSIQLGSSLGSRTDGLNGVGYGHEDEGHLTEQQVLVRPLYYKCFPRGAQVRVNQGWVNPPI